MPGKIFVNYRRGDDRSGAARIRDVMVEAFGHQNVFMDIADLQAGLRFDQELDKALAEADVLLAIVSWRWMDLLAERQASGERDFVREEIAAALIRGIAVIPVLMGRVRLPPAADLPEDIRGLAMHQGLVVTHERFGRDVHDLVNAVRRFRTAKWARPRWWFWGACLFISLAIAFASAYWLRLAL
jgi:TIR domain